MAEQPATELSEAAPPTVHVAPAPHVARGFTTRRMMIDVLAALLPVIGMSLYVFHWYAAMQIAICVAGCLAAEAVFAAMRGRPMTSVGDFSAAVTGVILALSLPWSAPWYVGVIGSFAAIGLGKAAFGGLGQNIFNPAMVGRAFVMIAFSSLLGASAYVASGDVPAAVTSATPMTARIGGWQELWRLFIGTRNGSLGEVSAWACLVGGLYLCIRRVASWEIPAGALLGMAVLAGAGNILDPQAPFTVLHHLIGGALLFGAFFIATDPVTSPLTPKGKMIFGLGIGALVYAIRTLSNYPEGVMFAVLLMNGMVPLLNRWTIPTPVGGRGGAKKA